MIQRKKKKIIQTRIIKIVYEGCVIYHGSTYELPILDEQVIAGSIKFFNDPEPCMIHRSAVISRYYLQIDEWFDKMNFDNESIVMFADLPESLKKLLDLKEVIS